MKKQIKKLSLNKKTISNLNSFEMKSVIGGSGPESWSPKCAITRAGNYTCNGKTCNKQCTL